MEEIDGPNRNVPSERSSHWEDEKVPDSIHNRQMQFSRRGISTSDDISEEDDFPAAAHSAKYPTEPPPAYSSGDHTPDEPSLLDNVHDGLISNSAPFETRGKSAVGAMIESVTGLAAATSAMGNVGKENDIIKLKDEDRVEDDEKLELRNATLIAPLSTDEKDLLLYIEAYTAESVRIEPFLKPFLLEYIPAVGDVDAFIKIPRPDEVEDNLGLMVLDEPAIQQSDPTILDMRLRKELKSSTPGIATDAPVKKLERADKNTEEIEQWINSIKLHRSRPPDTVHYSKPMPNIEQLMQEWPAEVENLLRKEQLPNASLDVPLEEYVDICLALLDIPVQKSRIQALHVLFTLFAEFRNSQHFRNLVENNLLKNFSRRNNAPEADRLEL